MSLKKAQVRDSAYADAQNALKIYSRFPGRDRPPIVVPKEKVSGRKKHDPDQPLTHFLLRGGHWNVEAPYNDEMLWHYAISMQQRHEFSLGE